MARSFSNPWRLIVLSLFVLSGCGGMRKGEQAPQSAPPSAGEAAAEAPADDVDQASGDEAQQEPATIEEAEAALRRAQAELSSALGEPVAFAQPPPPASQPAPAEAAGARDRSMEAEKKADGPNCGLACRAFTSLSRAAQAVCRLDGDGGERCSRARQAVSDAEARVASCSCTRP